MITKSWKNKDEEVTRVNIDDSSIVLEVNSEINEKFGKEIQELQKLNMFPLLDENKVEGERSENNWTRYVFKKGASWERAKEEMVKTFDFWLEGEIPSTVAL